MSAIEEWRPVRDYYEASSLGRVRSVARLIVDSRGHQYWRPGKLLTPQFLKGTGMSGSGHLRVKIRDRYVLVHHLILEAFDQPCPQGLECRHLNDDGLDNRIENLCWGTRTENARDKVLNGKNHNARKISCKWGHLLEGDNLGITTDGLFRRYCKKCKCRRTRQSRLKRMGAACLT